MNEDPSTNPSGLGNEDRERRMWEIIQGGGSIESVDEMSDEYYENLRSLMSRQADFELAAAYCRIPWVTKAPTLEERLAVADMVRDELHHARSIYRLLADIGIDPEPRSQEMEFFFDPASGDVEPGRDRGWEDSPGAVFSAHIDTWIDFVMFQFCLDRGVRHMLEDVRCSSYGPWKREIDRILKEEKAHESHGDFWVRKLAFDRSTKSDVQEALDRWYQRTMNMFGRVEAERDAEIMKLGLRARDDDEVRSSFTAEIRVRCSECGLRLVQWKPDWEQVEENGVISG